MNIYSKEDFKYLPSKDLKIGTKVQCLVSRSSGNISSWLRNSSKHHGYVLIDGVISSIDFAGKRAVKLDETQREYYEEPIGREKNVKINGRGDAAYQVVKIYGNSDVITK